MIKLYTASTSNGHRVAIMLEECGLRYSTHKIDLAAGEQRKAEFLQINPAGAVPVIVDPEGPDGPPLTLAQSAALLLYLASKRAKFLPVDPASRALAFQWLMFAASNVSMTSTMMFFNSVQVPDKSAANGTLF